MPETTWWKYGIVYQIYPRSFQDTNGDGIGDLKGICERLDYLTWLGVDAIWISPIYPSPMADFGYDIADYCGTDRIFGTLADFDHLVAEAHRKGLKVILDFVPNHTSDQHAWFRESRSSRTNPKRDWYIWRDGKPGGGLPNNWISNFGGPAWAWDEATRQYYYHAFLKEQPDLNWRNPDVRRAMHDVLRFWLDRGVDGFRVDVIWHLMKDPEFRDNPPNPGYQLGRPEIDRLLQVHSTDQPDVHEVIAEMRRVLDEYESRVLIGEIYLPIERLVAYYGADLSGAHLPFNFQLIQTAWNAHEIKILVNEYEQALPPGGWPNWVLGNHDQPRIGARVGEAQARVAAMLLLTLRGTPTMYYGDEIGLTRVEIPPDRVQDPWEKNEPGLGIGRDPERTPMQWDASRYAGFSTIEPWLPLAPDFAHHNVERLRHDTRSILTLYRRLIEFRRKHRALSVGSYVHIATQNHVFGYERRYRDERLMILLNLGHETETVALPRDAGEGSILISTHLDRQDEGVGSAVTVRPDEGIIIELEATPAEVQGGGKGGSEQMNDMPRITQEMINLYDEYTHVTLDRRGFLDRLTALVGSPEAARSLASLIEANKASAGLVAENDSRLETQSVTFGEHLTGYLAIPAGAAGKLPAVMVVHENRGLVPHIKDVVRRVALEGFLALGPDFLAPDGGTPEDEEQGREMIQKLDRGKVIANALAAISFLKSHPSSNGNVGAVGFCWGGGIVNAVAVAAGAGLKAAVPYYGAQPKAEDVGKIKAEMMLHYAKVDERINAGITAYKEALEKNGTRHQIFIYEGAQHAFNNDTSAARYDKKSADLAWSRTIAFLKQKLA